ncbi:CBS domain protein [Cooperia oncophora]
MSISSGRRRSFGGVTSKEVDHDSLAKLLMMNTCYEAMPTSGRVVVLDEDLVMWQAFHRIVTHATRHVLLSDSQQGGAITGILSVTDFIRVLLKLFRESKFVSREEANDLGLLTIRKYQGGFCCYHTVLRTGTCEPELMYEGSELTKKAGKWRNLVWISAESSLLEVVRLLSSHHVHRIPVIDPVTYDPIFILTHKRILKFIWCFGQSLFHHSFITQTPKQLGVGTWEGIRCVYLDTPLYECLDILLNLGVSGVPVVERDTHKVVDVYSRFDAIGIALQNEGFNLEITVKEALQFKHICNNNRQPVASVREAQSFYSVVSVLVERRVHRVCVVDENDVLQGIISLSDVMKTLVLEPGRHLNSRNIPQRRFSQSSFDVTNMQLYLRSLAEGSSVQ